MDLQQGDEEGLKLVKPRKQKGEGDSGDEGKGIFQSCAKYIRRTYAHAFIQATVLLLFHSRLLLVLLLCFTREGDGGQGKLRWLATSKTPLPNKAWKTVGKRREKEEEEKK